MCLFFARYPILINPFLYFPVISSTSATSGVVTFASCCARSKELIRPIPSPPGAKLQLVSIPLGMPSISTELIASNVSLPQLGKCSTLASEEMDKFFLAESDTLDSLGSYLDFDVLAPPILSAGFVGGKTAGMIKALANKRLSSQAALVALNILPNKRSRPTMPSSPTPIPKFIRTESPIRNVSARSSPTISSSDSDELDQQLIEELEQYVSEQHGSSQTLENREKTPVPLLTPPGSPLTVVLDSGMTTICEWPSNLIVDSAMQAANELRSLSPASLELLEIDEQDRLGCGSVSFCSDDRVINVTPLPVRERMFSI